MRGNERTKCVGRLAMAKGKVGIVGLGIMGGAFARNLLAAGWRVVGYDIDAARRRAMARAGVEIADDAKTLAGEVGTIITSLPKPAALGATVTAIVNARVRSRVIIEASTFTIDDKLKAERALRKAGHVMLDCPVSGTGAQAKVKDLVVYASGDPQATPAVRRVRARGARPRRVRQRQPHEICRQPSGRDQQRRQRRGYGARPQGRPRRADRVRHGQIGRRQFARIRIAGTHDGGGSLRRGQYENVALAEGHGGHRRIRAAAALPDADVR